MKLFSLVASSSATALFVSSGHGYIVNPEYLDKVGIDIQKTPDNCKIAFDIGHIQDISSTYESALGNLMHHLPLVVDYANVNYEGSRLGFATFVDKPLPRTGWDLPGFRKDFCLHVENGFEEPNDELYERLQKHVKVGGGKDWPEGQLDALARAAVTPKFRWRKEDKLEGKHVVRLAVVTTDAVPHFPGDAANAVLNHNTQVLRNKGDPSKLIKVPTASQVFDKHSEVLKDENAGCAEWDYPTPAEIGKALAKKKILPVFLLSPATFTGECKKEPCAWKSLRERAKSTNDLRYLDPVLGIQMVYEALLDEMQMPGVILVVSPSMVDYSTQMERTFKSVESLACYHGVLSGIATFNDVPQLDLKPITNFDDVKHAALRSVSLSPVKTAIPRDDLERLSNVKLETEDELALGKQAVAEWRQLGLSGLGGDDAPQLGAKSEHRVMLDGTLFKEDVVVEETKTTAEKEEHKLVLGEDNKEEEKKEEKKEVKEEVKTDDKKEDKKANKKGVQTPPSGDSNNNNNNNNSKKREHALALQDAADFTTLPSIGLRAHRLGATAAADDDTTEDKPGIRPPIGDLPKPHDDVDTTEDKPGIRPPIGDLPKPHDDTSEDKPGIRPPIGDLPKHHGHGHGHNHKHHHGDGDFSLSPTSPPQVIGREEDDDSEVNFVDDGYNHPGKHCDKPCDHHHGHHHGGCCGGKRHIRIEVEVARN